ncbi:MAG: hypothetical protein ACYTXY_45495, partial [Nostoc sp.]
GSLNQQRSVEEPKYIIKGSLKPGVTIGLREEKLIVIGENHGQNNTTLLDIVKATGTKRYMYEALTVVPEDIKEDEDDSIKVKIDQNHRRKELSSLKLGTDDSENYAAEDLYPKILRTLYYIQDGSKN